MILLDVGVWLAAVWGRHAHHPATADWFGRQTGDLVFCRVTQMSLLRLLSNAAIMGDDAVDRSQAWRTFDQLWADERVLWADEPDELDAVWRAISARDDKSHKRWTDDYLAAFAQASDFTLATLDGKFPSRYPSVRVESLLPLPIPSVPSAHIADYLRLLVILGGYPLGYRSACSASSLCGNLVVGNGRSLCDGSCRVRAWCP